MDQPSNKRSHPGDEGVGRAGSEPKRDRSLDLALGGVCGAIGAEGGISRSTSDNSVALEGQPSTFTGTSTTSKGPVPPKLSAKQHATLRKYILIADPSLSSQTALLEKVGTVMTDTWSWDELKKFFLRKAEMKENVEATLDLIREDLSDEEMDDEEGLVEDPAPGQKDEGEDLQVKGNSLAAVDVDMTSETPVVPAPPPAQPTSASQVPQTADIPSLLAPTVRPGLPAPPPLPTPSAADPPSSEIQSFAIESSVESSTTTSKREPAPSVDVEEITAGPSKTAIKAKKKQATKHLPVAEKQRLAREKVEAEGKVWFEPEKKKAMTALQTETREEIQRGEFQQRGAEDTLGRQFLNLRDARSLRVKERCAVMAVVISLEHRMGRGDPLALLKLQDPTGTLQVNAFVKRADMLPRPTPGSVVMLRNVYLDAWSGNTMLVGSAKDGYDIAYTNSKVTTITCPSNLESRYGKLEMLSASMHALALKLGAWSMFSLGLTGEAPELEQGETVEEAPAPVVHVKKTRRRMRVEELEDATEFFDLIAQIVMVGPRSEKIRDVFVTDFTLNPRLFKNEIAFPPLNEAAKPTAPFGRYTLKLSLWEHLAKEDNSSLSPGKIVYIRNAKVRVRDHIEGTLWGDRNSGCRIDRLGQADKGVAELVERRAAFAQALLEESRKLTDGSSALLEIPASQPLPPPPTTLVVPQINSQSVKDLQPLLTVREVSEGTSFSCIGQVVTSSLDFVAEDRQTYRSFRITDFTSHPRIAEFPDSNAGSIESPPTLPFGQYVLRVLLSGKYASEKTEYKAGDFVLLQNVRVNGKGGRGLEGYIASESCSAYPIKVIMSPASELGPLLLQRARFYSRRRQKRTPAPEEEREVLTIASPITHVADDGGDVSMETPQEGTDGGLDSIPKSRAPTPDRFSLLKDAKVNTVLDGLFQIVQVHSWNKGDTFFEVTDWTPHALITERHPPLPDPDVVNVQEPFGRYVLEVRILHPPLQKDCEFLDALAPGAIVRLRGLRLVRSQPFGLRGHLLQTNSSGWSRVREDSADPAVLNLQARRAATYQLSATPDGDVGSTLPAPAAAQPPPDQHPAPAPHPALAAPNGLRISHRAASSAAEASPTESLYFKVGETLPTSLKAVVESSSCPAKYKIRARVVDFSPKNLEDVVVCVCTNCAVILPTIDKACRACLSQSSGSLGDEVEWTYRLMLDLDDGTSRIKAALFDQDFLALFPGVPPADMYCQSATQTIDRLRSNLSLLHPAFADHSLAIGQGQVGVELELGLVSFWVGGVKGLKEGEERRAYRIFRTVLREA